MAENEEDDAFLYDEFADIPDDELQRLEQDAITYTQQEQGSSRPQKQGASVTGSKLAQKPNGELPKDLVQLSEVRRPRVQNGQKPGTTSIQQTSSDSTILDEDGLPLVVEEQDNVSPQRYLDETTRREQWRLERFADPQARSKAVTRAQPLPTRYQGHGSLAPQQRPQQWSEDARVGQPQSPTASFVNQRRTEEESLYAKIAELTRERDELTTSLNAAKEEVYVRRGEIANVRAKQSAEEKIFQRQLSAIQKSKQEEAEKHVTSLQAKNAENAKIASEIQFLKQELKEESRKAQSFQRQLKEKPLTDKPNNVNKTPKHNNTLRDGFDDDEIMMLSPVKSGRRSKPGTPTANRKRKQPTSNEADLQPLALRLSGVDSDNVGQSAANPVLTDQQRVVVQKDRLTQQHLRLVQKVVSFKPGGGSEVLTDCLAKFSFPSDKGKSFSAITLEALSRLEGRRLAGDLLQVFLDLWSRALKEKYHVCIQLLVEVVGLVLDLDPFTIDTLALKNCLPLLQSTVSINAVARFNLAKKDYLYDASIPTPKIDRNINPTNCLKLLHCIACLCVDDASLIELVWRSMDTDFVLMMLNACQPITDVTLTLQLLATSILPNTFGNICEPSEQGRMETYICDRICYTLWETPKADVDRPAYNMQQRCLLRIESLKLLAQLTIGSSTNPFNPATARNHGTSFIANHPTAIARIVRSIYDELAVAYQMTPTQKLHIQLVNTATRILHFVLSSPAGREIDLQRKLAGTNGGAHKYRVAMTRLAFAEGTEPGLDAGITEDTIRMATELLDESVTPDEVDDLVTIFHGMNSSNAGNRRASAISSTQN